MGRAFDEIAEPFAVCWIMSVQHLNLGRKPDYTGRIHPIDYVKMGTASLLTSIASKRNPTSLGPLNISFCEPYMATGPHK